MISGFREFRSHLDLITDYLIYINHFDGCCLMIDFKCCKNFSNKYYFSRMKKENEPDYPSAEQLISGKV